MPPSSRSAHSGIVLRWSRTPVCVAREASGLVSSASTALSTARPRPSSLAELTRAWGEGPRSPEAWTSTAGMPRGSRTPCSPAARGNMRWATCPSREGLPGFQPPSCTIASRDRPLELQRSRAEPVRVGDDEGGLGAPAGEVPEHDRRIEWSVQGAGQVGRPGVAPAAAAGRGEDDRALGLPGREDPGQLQQGGGARELRAGGSHGGVPVGDHQDRRLVGRPGPFGDHREQAALAVDRLPFQVAPAHGEAAAGRAPEPLQGAGNLRGHRARPRLRRPAVRGRRPSAAAARRRPWRPGRRPEPGSRSAEPAGCRGRRRRWRVRRGRARRPRDTGAR